MGYNVRGKVSTPLTPNPVTPLGVPSVVDPSSTLSLGPETRGVSDCVLGPDRWMDLGELREPLLYPYHVPVVALELRSVGRVS